MPIFRLFCLLALSLASFGTQAQPDRQTPEARRDSLQRLIATLEDPRERFLKYLDLYAGVSVKDSVLLARYDDTLRTFEDRVPPDFFAGQYHFALAKTARYRRDFPLAKEELARALAGFVAYDSLKMAVMRGRAHQTGSVLGLASEDYEYGYTHARESVRLLRGVPEEEANLAGVLNNLGTLLQRAGLYDDALPHFRESVILYERLGRPDRKFHPLNNLGAQFTRQGELDSAEYYYRLALEAVEQQSRPNPVQRAYVQNNLAAIYEKQDKLELGLKTVSPAVLAFREAGAQRELAAAAGSAAGLLLKLNRPAEALPYLREAGRAGGDFPGVVEELQRRFTEAFIATGQPDSAVYYFGAYRESLKNNLEKRSENALADAEAKFQNEQKQLEIDKLEATERLSQERIERQRLTIGGILGVLGLLGFLLYRLYGQRQQIASQNKVITRSLADKEVLLKEIHHRVKNNLQMVSSLLSLQSRYVADDTAVAALRMGNSRVRSMALIHQKLYLRDEVTTAIGTREYLEKLLNELVGNLTETGKPVSVFADIEEVEVDIDTMIPLGLIANELITNSLKYAFTGRDHGHLEMLLTRMGDRLRVTFRDDGIGLQHDPSREPTSFGYLLINSLVEQLDGQLSVSGTSGTTVVLEVPVS